MLASWAVISLLPWRYLDLVSDCSEAELLIVCIDVMHNKVKVCVIVPIQHKALQERAVRS